jgi:hypothetical protein
MQNLNGTATAAWVRRCLSPRRLREAFSERFDGFSRKVRISLLLLLSVNVVLFGAAMGTMDIMMLYPQVRQFTLVATASCTCYIRSSVL